MVLRHTEYLAAMASVATLRSPLCDCGDLAIINLAMQGKVQLCGWNAWLACPRYHVVKIELTRIQFGSLGSRFCNLGFYFELYIRADSPGSFPESKALTPALSRLPARPRLRLRLELARPPRLPAPQPSGRQTCDDLRVCVSVRLRIPHVTPELGLQYVSICLCSLDLLDHSLANLVSKARVAARLGHVTSKLHEMRGKVRPVADCLRQSDSQT